MQSRYLALVQINSGQYDSAIDLPLGKNSHAHVETANRQIIQFTYEMIYSY